jgi:drug/metabolite transporter (DMT)-like permease
MKSDSLGSADGGISATSVVPFVCLLGVVLLLSTITLTVKYVFQHSGVQPIELAWFRVMIGFAFLCSVTLLWDRRGLLSLAGSEILLLIAVGFLGVFSYAVAAYGLMHTSVTHYALIYSLLPSSTATLSVLMGKDQLAPAKLAGIVLSLIGCVVAVSDGARPAEAGFGFGDMFVLLFTIMMSAHIVFSSGIVRRFGSMVSNTVMFGSSAVFLSVVSWPVTERTFESLPPLIIGGMMYIGLATAAVFLLRYRSLQSLSPGTVGIYHNFIPIVTVLLAYFCLGEPIGWQTIIGGIAVVAGAELVRSARIPACLSLRAWAKPLLPAVASHKSLRE